MNSLATTVGITAGAVGVGISWAITAPNDCIGVAGISYIPIAVKIDQMSGYSLA